MDIRACIIEKLEAIEADHDVKVLYASESGSRAWGSPSRDSDYDIRFIYARKPDWYLSIMPKRDVIDLPIVGEIDMGGWDIRKSIALLRKSNCALIEWLSSPIVYKENVEATLPIKQIVPRAFLATHACHHYLAMAKRKTSETKQDAKVKLKTYFYALRATLCAKYIVDHNCPPPMLIDELIDEYVGDKEENDSLAELKYRKENGTEGDRVDRIDWLDAILDEIQGSVEKNIPPNQEKQPLDFYDHLFRQTLNNVWGN